MINPKVYLSSPSTFVLSILAGEPSKDNKSAISPTLSIQFQRVITSLNHKQSMQIFLFHKILHLIQQNPLTRLTPTLIFSDHSPPFILASSINPKMAATFATSSTIVGLGSSSLQSSRVSSPKRSAAALTSSN